MKPWQRWMMYLTGVLLGSALAWGLVSRHSARGTTPSPKVPVLLTACVLSPGDTVTDECLVVEEVSSRRIPPGVVPVAQRSELVGKQVKVRLVAGSALRNEDFEQ